MKGKDLSSMVEINSSTIAGFFPKDHQRFVRFACHLSGDRDTAEDIVSSVYLKLVKTKPSVAQSKVMNYMLKSIENMFLDNKKGRHKLTSSLSSFNERGLEKIESLKVNPYTILEEKETLEEQRALVHEAIERMRPEEREAFQYRIVRGFTCAETARAMGKTKGAAKMSTHRAYNCLRRTLAEHGIDWSARARPAYGLKSA